MVKPILSRIVAAGRGDKMPSFHIDLMAGKKENEVSFHNGAVVQAGRELDIPTPVNNALTEILLMIARKEIDYQLFNGRPQKLVSEIEQYKEKK
jgi:2-dehydropantoate 2-reductase